MFSTRRTRHELMSASLAARDEDELAALITDALGGAVGVGGASSVIDVDGTAVFVKRIPITDRELAHPHSTANLFGLPTACQYDMHPLAGPGFGAWRELAANLTVTEGVLAGASEHFALLHHWRVLAGRPPVADEHQDVDSVVAQFGGDPAYELVSTSSPPRASASCCSSSPSPIVCPTGWATRWLGRRASNGTSSTPSHSCGAASCSISTGTSETCERTTTASISWTSGWRRRRGSSCPSPNVTSSRATSTMTPTTPRCGW